MTDIKARCGNCDSGNLLAEEPDSPNANVYCQDCGTMVGTVKGIQDALTAEGKRLAGDLFKNFGKGKGWKNK